MGSPFAQVPGALDAARAAAPGGGAEGAARGSGGLGSRDWDAEGARSEVVHLRQLSAASDGYKRSGSLRLAPSASCERPPAHPYLGPPSARSSPARAPSRCYLKRKPI